jgi:hypothetical protein
MFHLSTISSFSGNTITAAMYLFNVQNKKNPANYDLKSTSEKTLFDPIYSCTLRRNWKETLFFSRNIKCSDHETLFKKINHHTMC